MQGAEKHFLCSHFDLCESKCRAGIDKKIELNRVSVELKNSISYCITYYMPFPVQFIDMSWPARSEWLKNPTGTGPKQAWQIFPNQALMGYDSVTDRDLFSHFSICCHNVPLDLDLFLLGNHSWTGVSSPYVIDQDHGKDQMTHHNNYCGMNRDNFKLKFPFTHQNVFEKIPFNEPRARTTATLLDDNVDGSDVTAQKI